MLELLRSLRGKKREWVNPDQMLLFKIGDLEQLVQEVREQEKQTTKRTPKKHGRRLIPDGLPQEIIEYTLPESDLVCPVDGKVMEPIRWEEREKVSGTFFAHKVESWGWTGESKSTLLIIKNGGWLFSRRGTFHIPNEMKEQVEEYFLQYCVAPLKPD